MSIVRVRSTVLLKLGWLVVGRLGRRLLVRITLLIIVLISHACCSPCSLVNKECYRDELEGVFVCETSSRARVFEGFRRCVGKVL